MSAQQAGSSGAGARPVLFKKKRGLASSRLSSSAPSASAKDAVAGPSRLAVSSRSSRLNTSAGDAVFGADESGDDDDDDDAAAASAVVVKKKRMGHNPLMQSTGSSLKRLRNGSAANSLGEEDFVELNGYDEHENGAASGSTHRLSAPRSSIARAQQDATRHSDWDLEIQGSANDPTRSSAETVQANADGIYRGAKGYASFVPTRDDGQSSKMKARGPIRQQTTVRSVTVMDYQPDICKDYKETGYCGFGDTCKFLHDRSDYLAGWQLDSIAPNSSKRREDLLLSDPEPDEGDDGEEEHLPFACLICRKPFVDPVVTKCGHYFCETCAIKRYAKTSKCFACGAQTGGLFNSASKLLHKLKAAKEQKTQSKLDRRIQLGLVDLPDQPGSDDNTAGDHDDDDE
ncbi:hypothetical protein BCV70DRAFT_198401 [Testicularia cyperi]|uniref:Pre-mRNA-splicing factor CWC24 n=1 Tax=Testicularia cyperi TaxID=1882483 RepID=A0A317XW30_9BASI|nr:hypothetical protein BCV70DRAFT_198401 [Testicularia cyperi]